MRERYDQSYGADQPPRLAPRGLSIPDAAAYIGVTPFFIERMIRCGRLPALRMCRQYTVLVSDLDAFLDSQPKVNPAVFAAPPNDRRRWRKGRRTVGGKAAA